MSGPDEEEVVDIPLVQSDILSVPLVVNDWSFQPYHKDYGVDNRERRPHCCTHYLAVNGLSQLFTHDVVVRQHEVCQSQAQVPEGLVEVGMLIHKPP